MTSLAPTQAVSSNQEISSFSPLLTVEQFEKEKQRDPRMYMMGLSLKVFAFGAVFERKRRQSE